MKKYIEAQIPRNDLTDLSSLALSGLALFSATLAVWSLTSNLKITNGFPVSSGLFSNWIVWTAFALGFQVLSRHISRQLAIQMHQSASSRQVQTQPEVILIVSDLITSELTEKSRAKDTTIVAA